ncbi:hypothetical protein RN001_005031 [Aquatica leii]|uniref:DUF4806 domain-containing protein n=1 Tax=Aquatica leii TaxID=1421715 RepID=A0AAN7PBF6_9COLE|nr:hypothetical protein RN001_005031 [Aquatica leii]
MFIRILKKETRKAILLIRVFKPESAAQRDIRICNTTFDSYSYKCHGQDTIDRQLSDIKFEIKDLRKTLERIENLLLSKTANNLEIGETEEDLFQNLPVSSVEELKNFNIKLEDKQVLNRLVAFLYVLGREDAHKTIYVMLKKVMTNEVAQLFSTQGRKQERAFLELKNLYGAITSK